MKVYHPTDRRRSEELSFMVDSGAYYSFVPAPVLEKLGIEPDDTRKFLLANGEMIERKIGTARFEYGEAFGGAPVVFGEAGDENLLGTTTLESLGLMLNPVKRKLYQVTPQI